MNRYKAPANPVRHGDEQRTRTRIGRGPGRPRIERESAEWENDMVDRRETTQIGGRAC